MSRVVVDSSFLVEYLFSKDEDFMRKARKRITELARSGRGLLPTLVISEVIRIVCSRSGAERGRIVHHSLIGSGLKIVPIDEEIAYEAGVLKCKHPNVPLADCIVAAVAKRYKAVVLSDDAHFDKIKGLKRIWV